MKKLRDSGILPLLMQVTFLRLLCLLKSLTKNGYLSDQKDNHSGLTYDFLTWFFFTRGAGKDN